MTTAFSPVGSGERITAIDAVRGFALLGIFMVNIQSFGEPFGAFILPTPEAGSAWTDVAAFYFVKVFCESKFYPLFAMLFGFGLMMQAERAAARGRSYWAPGVRRYVFLTFLGALHALLLWFGDILFIYGLGGLFLLVMHRSSTKVLAVTGSVFLAVALLLMTGFSILTAATAKPPEEQSPVAAFVDQAQAESRAEAASRPAVENPAEAQGAEAPAKPSPTPDDGDSTEGQAENAERVIGDGKIGGFDTPVMRLFKDLQAGKAAGGPSDPLWMQHERDAYTSGRTIDRMLFNAFSWSMFLIVCLLGFGWDVLAMLLLGGVLCRLRLFDESRSHWHVRFVWVAVLVGLPLAVLGATAGLYLPQIVAAPVFSGGALLFGPLLSLGMLSAITLMVRSRTARPVTGALSCVGRLALSNYLLQTLVASFIFYEWGLGLYGQTSRGERLLIVLGVYACQVVLSVLWLKMFRYGPMEYVWRTVTYLRRPGRGDTAAA